MRRGELVATQILCGGLERGFADEDDEGFTLYEHLGDVPELFLKFTRPHEETDFEGATLRFTREYGLLDREQKLPSPNRVGVQVGADRLMWTRFSEEVRRA